MSKKNQNQVARVEKRTQAFNLVVQGLSFRQVADELGISRSTAFRYFNEVMKDLKVPEEKLKEWRILVAHRLDMAEAPLLKAVAKHNSGKTTLSIRDLTDIARAVARIEQRRARMLGIDKPSKIDITHHIPALDPEAAAQRQRQRLKTAQFPELRTEIPAGLLTTAEVVNGANGDS